MSDQVRFSSVTFACPNPAELAAFYADLTGGDVTFIHESEWASVRCPGAKLEFMGVADYQPPTWPEDSSLVHVDFHVDDLEDAAARAESCGAHRYEHQPNAAHCLVLSDPVGHPFCLSLIDNVG
ncbi:VOC family protein [soil metagenome]